MAANLRLFRRLHHTLLTVQMNKPGTACRACSLCRPLPSTHQCTGPVRSAAYAATASTRDVVRWEAAMAYFEDRGRGGCTRLICSRTPP